MNKTVLLYGILVLFWTLMLIISCDDDKMLWGKINSPILGGQITLYQKDRIMHQTPEILVYFQRKGSWINRPIGNILLPEDNRSKFTYEYRVERKGELILSLNCKHCMIDQREYAISFSPIPQMSEVIESLKSKPISEK